MILTAKKITELTEETTPVGADLAAIVDDVAGTPTTKKATLTNFSKGLDHGNIGGLADDDHTQYLLATGARAGSSFQAQSFGATGIKADVVAEHTATAGVTVDGLPIKDSGFVLGSDATGDLYYRNASGVLTRLGIGSTDHVLKVAAGLPSWAAAAGSGVTWNNVTGTSQTLAKNNAYIANAATLCTLTLPAVADTSVTDYIRVSGAGAGGWRIAQVALSQIIWNEGGVDGTHETTIGTGGRLDSTDDRDSVELVCTADDGTNVTWTVVGAKGTITLT